MFLVFHPTQVLMDKTYHYSIVKNDGRNADYIALELYFQIGEKQDRHKHIPFVYFLKVTWTLRVELILSFYYLWQML